eukprot:gene8612-biopygen7636
MRRNGLHRPRLRTNKVFTPCPLHAPGPFHSPAPLTERARAVAALTSFRVPLTHGEISTAPHPPRRGALWPGTTAVVSRTAESEGTDRPRRACCRSSLSLWASCYHGCALHGMTGGGSTFFIGSAPRRRASGDYSMQRKRRPSPPPSSEACTCVPTLPVSATGGAAVLDHGQRVSITGNVHGHAKRVRGWTTGKPRLLEAPDGWKNVWMQMSAPQSAHNAPKSLPPPDHGAHRYQAWGA